MFIANQQIQEALNNIEIIDRSTKNEKKKALTSNTQRKIAAILRDMGYLVEEDKRIKPFQVDIFINPDLIIEYNGLSHYYYYLNEEKIEFEGTVDKN